MGVLAFLFLYMGVALRTCACMWIHEYILLCICVCLHIMRYAGIALLISVYVCAYFCMFAGLRWDRRRRHVEVNRGGRPVRFWGCQSRAGKASLI